MPEPDAKRLSYRQLKRARRRREEGRRTKLREVRRQMKARTLDRARQFRRR
jgi:hypothetical protein